MGVCGGKDRSRRGNSLTTVSEQQHKESDGIGTKTRQGWSVCGQSASKHQVMMSKRWDSSQSRQLENYLWSKHQSIGPVLVGQTVGITIENNTQDTNCAEASPFFLTHFDNGAAVCYPRRSIRTTSPRPQEGWLTEGPR